MVHCISKEASIFLKLLQNLWRIFGARLKHLRPTEASAAARSNYAVVLLLLVHYVSPPQGRETLFYPVRPSDCPSQIVSNLVNATPRTLQVCFFSRSDDVHDV